MIEAIKFWNEPNNLSHWDFLMDPGWVEFAQMTILGAQAVRQAAPHLPRVLGGMSPIDPEFLNLLASHGVMEHMDIVAVHGFPLDWNHWQINDWPQKLADIRRVTDKPIWVTEVGASTFGAEEVQVFGLQRTADLLLDEVDRVFWYSLFDLPPTWEATTRHKESEGSSYYRHFYLGLIRDDGTPKPAFDLFDPRMGICQWFHFEDHRLDKAVEWLRRLGVKKLRTGISWADWHRPNAVAWFDRQMDALSEFDTTITLCFTPPSRGKREHHTSPPPRAGAVRLVRRAGGAPLRSSGRLAADCKANRRSAGTPCGSWPIVTTTFLLIRHASHGLLGKRMAGRMPGVHLSDAGQAEAQELAARLSSAPLAAVYSSPLERACETAAPIAASKALPIQVCNEINELDYGDWTGKTFEELDVVAGWHPYNVFRSGLRIPGGEMMLEAQTRMVVFMQSLCARHPDQSVALVSHADLIKGAVAYYLGVPLDLFLRIEIEPASVSIVALDEYGPHILRVNATGVILS